MGTMAAFMDTAAAGLLSSDALPLARTTSAFLTSLALACGRALPHLSEGEISNDIDNAVAIVSKMKSANALKIQKSSTSTSDVVVLLYGFLLNSSSSTLSAVRQGLFLLQQASPCSGRL